MINCRDKCPFGVVVIDTKLVMLTRYLSSILLPQFFSMHKTTTLLNLLVGYEVSG